MYVPFKKKKKDIEPLQTVVLHSGEALAGSATDPRTAGPGRSPPSLPFAAETGSWGGCSDGAATTAFQPVSLSLSLSESY